MKKMFVLITVVFMVLLGSNVYNGCTCKDLSDEELVSMYLVEEFGEENCEVEICGDRNGMIEYLSYKDGKITHVGSINRDWYADEYNTK